MIEAIASVPVTVSGFTWTAAGAWATFIVLLGVLIRQFGPWRKQVADEQQNLITRLTDRVDKIEKQLESERKVHYIEIRRIEARGAAQRALDRHRFNNSEACLDSLLRILELSPDKAPEAARQAREQRADQRKIEQLESAEIHKAEIEAVEAAERELAAGG